MTEHRDFYLEAPVYDEAVVTNDAWPTPETHGHLLPRDESLAARWWRVVLSWWGMWL